jgi:hypothetical protein
MFANHMPGYREHRILRISFWIKLHFVVVEIILAIAFIACTFTGHYDGGAVLEWVIAFIFTFYALSFFVDLYPAVRTRNSSAREGRDPSTRYKAGRQMEEAGGSDRQLMTGTAPLTGDEPPAHASRTRAVPNNF